jgi:hypothetical protein
MRPLRAAVLCAALAGCDGGTTGPSPPADAATYASAHFTFQYTPLDAANIAAIAGAVEREYERILADLGVVSMPRVHVTLYAGHAAMESAARPVVGIVPPGTAGLVTSATQIHLMSPNHPSWAPYERMLSHLVHEFAHCVSLHVNPRIGNNPRWLWESVALYESRQSVDLGTIAYMRALAPPSFAALSRIDDTRVYDVGHSIAEFIVWRWGQRALRDLVVANGDTAGVLGVGLAELERDWFAFARERYGF